MDIDFMKLSTSEEHNMDHMMMLMQLENENYLNQMTMEYTNFDHHLQNNNNNNNLVYENTTHVDGAGEFSGKRGSMAAMREMIFRMAAMQPVNIDPEAVKPPRRRNVRISTDPQSVAARHRRERISEKIRILQRLVPGGTKMDTASMLDEAIHYVKFLKDQVRSLERAAANRPPAEMGFPVAAAGGSCFPVADGGVDDQCFR